MKLGFGCYRIADGNLQHEQALQFAIESGIKTIDTSTNYSSGLSEQLVGKVAARFDRGSLTIISKAGYIQGEMLKAFEGRETTDDVVEYRDDLYHCIHPDFLEAQITLSLDRLNMDYIDTYLLHNPEYFLFSEIDSNEDVKQTRASMNRRIYDAFIALENEVQKGRIKSYGISSNAFSFSADDMHFLPYETLPELAKLAALEVGHSSSSFTHIQLPINLLETEGLKCAKWAKKEGLKVIANRPLNAFKDKLGYRLATPEYPEHYESYLNEVLELASENHLELLENFIGELDTISHRFGFIGEYENFLFMQVVPTLRKALADIADEYFESVVELINLFLESYKDKVAYEIAKRTPNTLKAMDVAISEPMQNDALGFLLQEENIDTVLVGMRNLKYVKECLTIENAL